MGYDDGSGDSGLEHVSAIPCLSELPFSAFCSSPAPYTMLSIHCSFPIGLRSPETWLFGQNPRASVAVHSINIYGVTGVSKQAKNPVSFNDNQRNHLFFLPLPLTVDLVPTHLLFKKLLCFSPVKMGRVPQRPCS